MIHNLEGQYGYILSLSFSTDSLKLAITSRDCSCYVWNVADRLLEKEIIDHKQAATSLSYAQDILVTVSKDCSFILYDSANDF